MVKYIIRFKTVCGPITRFASTKKQVKEMIKDYQREAKLEDQYSFSVHMDATEEFQ
jgi:hypothetical protein